MSTAQRLDISNISPNAQPVYDTMAYSIDHPYPEFVPNSAADILEENPFLTQYSGAHSRGYDANGIVDSAFGEKDFGELLQGSSYYTS